MLPCNTTGELATGEGHLEVDDLRAALKFMYGGQKYGRSRAAKNYAGNSGASDSDRSAGSDSGDETDKEGGNNDVGPRMY